MTWVDADTSLSFRIEKLRHLADENRTKANAAYYKRRPGKAGYHMRRAKHFDGLTVQLIVERETR